MSELLEAGAIVPAALLNAVLDRVGPFTSAEVDDLDTDFPYPFTGQIVHVTDIDCDVRWDGTKWVPQGAGGLPDPVEMAKANGENSFVTATTFAALPTHPVSIPIDLPFDCWCDIRFGASAMSAAANDLALTYVLSGATTRAAQTPPANAKYSSNTAGTAGVGVEPQVKLLAGTTTATLQAKRGAATGTQIVYAPYLQIVPVRWA